MSLLLKITLVVLIVGGAGSGWVLTTPRPWSRVGAALRIFTAVVPLVLAWLTHALLPYLGLLTGSLLVGVLVRRRARREPGVARS